MEIGGKTLKERKEEKEYKILKCLNRAMLYVPIGSTIFGCLFVFIKIIWENVDKIGNNLAILFTVLLSSALVIFLITGVAAAKAYEYFKELMFFDCDTDDNTL